MNKHFLRSLQLSLALTDISAINIVFFSSEFIFRKQALISPDIEYVYFGFFLSTAWLLVALVLNIYKEKNVLSFEQFTKISTHAFIYYILIITLNLFFLRLLLLSRIFIVVVLGCIFIALLVNRFIYLAVYQYFKNKEWLVSKVVIIGYNSLSKKLVAHLTEEGINKRIIGFCEDSENVNELSHYPILSTVQDAFAVCKEHGVTEIYSTIAPEHNQSIYQLIQEADQNCIRFKIVPDLGIFMKKQMHIDFLKEIPVISLRNEPLEDLSNRIKKRIFDICVSLFVTIFILSWLIPIISLFILIESWGPIFFVQARSGKDNKPFYCLKFRSMQVNADEQQATRNDARVTRVGKFLRRTSLDEFPQFLNVLKGDMSIVGPRPHMLKQTNEYSKLIGQYMIRQFLKPGITGWAQVNGFRGETQTVLQMQKRVEHDLWYMENWSLWKDLQIIFMTVINTFKGEENAF